MPTSNSAKKRMRQNVVHRERNKSRKSRAASAEKKFRAAVDAKDPEKAKTLYAEACSALDRAVNSKALHKNKADRKKSRLQTLLQTLEA